MRAWFATRIGSGAFRESGWLRGPLEEEPWVVCQWFPLFEGDAAAEWERGNDSACASWDGSQHTWNDYVRKVRLQWARTPEKRKGLLGAELVSRLSGKAWDVTRELDFDRLQDRAGAAYLLEVLEQRLGRTPVPDLGVRLEQLFMRTRRSPGQSMSQWSAELREAYRNLQRAMARARAGSPLKAGSPKAGETGSPAKLSSTALRRRSWTTAEPEPGFGIEEEDREPGEGDLGEHPDHELPVADERRTGTHSREAGDATAETTRAWTAEEWEAWYSGWNGKKQGRWESKSDGGASSAARPQLPEPKWERFALEEIEVLPPEILGWLLLRRANLSSASRLAILSVTGNKLEFDLVEKALRDQEEDLLASERQRDPRAQRQRRSYWVEDQGEWGLLAEDFFDEATETGDNVMDIHWVGNRLPAEVYPVEEAEEEWTSYGHDGAEIHWVWYDNEWQTQDAEGTWWTWSDSKPWLEIDECMAVDPLAGKEIADTFATFQDKVRTFRESRNLMKAAQTSRGFYPLKGSKGSKKGRPKGKGPGRAKGKGGTVLALQSERGSSSSTSGQRPGQPEYTGCFICGAKDHEFKNCPKRKVSGKPSGSAGRSYFITEVTNAPALPENEFQNNHTAMEEHNLEVPQYETKILPEFLVDNYSPVPEDELQNNHTAVEEHNLEVPCQNETEFVYMVSPIDEQRDGQVDPTPPSDGALLCNTEILYEVPYPESTFTVNALESMWATTGQMYPGYAVLDSGATESVGSLEAIQAVMHRRRELYGVETVKICPNPRKTFRFGDGEQLSAMSYVELPQKLHRREISFSVYSLDVPRVPILMSIRTLKKLGAIVDFGERTVCFHKVDQSIVIPLTETRSGHLLIDLTKDWLNAAGNPEIGKDRPTYVTTSSHSGEQYMRAGEELCEGDQCVLTACVPAHDMSDRSAVPVFDLSSPELDHPVEECDECLQMGSAIARPTSQFAFALACGVHGAAAPDGADVCTVHPVGDFDDGILGLPGEEEGPEGEGQDSRGRAVRFLETGRPGPSRRANSWSTLLRRAPDHEAWAREPLRLQRSRMVASVREMPVACGVRTSLGRARTFSPSRSSQRRREEGSARGHGEGEDWRGRGPQRAQRQECGFGRCGTVTPGQAEQGACGKGEKPGEIQGSPGEVENSATSYDDIHVPGTCYSVSGELDRRPDYERDPRTEEAPRARDDGRGAGVHDPGRQLVFSGGGVEGVSEGFMVGREKEEIEDVADRLLVEERYEDKDCLDRAYAGSQAKEFCSRSSQ